MSLAHKGRRLLRPLAATAVVALAAALAVGTVVTPKPQGKAPMAPPPAEPGITARHAYSPFAVRVSGHPAFEVITFKRVGRGVPQHSDPSYEELAEALAMSLELEASGVVTEVVYSPDLLDPDNHVFCDADHLYVDYWRTEPDGWGYSLWSGCGAEDRFAWTEFPMSTEPSNPIDALSAHILAALEKADRKGCYRKTC